MVPVIGKPWGGIQAATAGLLGQASWFKSILVAEMAILFIIAVALTVAPQVTLGAIADASARARDFSLNYRPAVALFGLLLVAATAAGLRALLRTGQEGVLARTVSPGVEGAKGGRAAA